MKYLDLTKKEVNELIKKAQNGDKEALDYLVSENMGLVRSVTKRFINRGCEYDDLMQIGSIGLLKAIKGFDSSYDVRFSTYAIPMIIGEIKRFLRDDGLIKVSRNLKELAIKAFALREVLEKSMGVEPTISELAAELDIEKEDLVLAINSQNNIQSLQEIINQGEGSPIELIDRILIEDSEELDIVNKIALKEVLSNLKQKDRQIIILRYFKELTQCQVADLLGISQVQVSRLEKKILQNLRKMI